MQQLVYIRKKTFEWRPLSTVQILRDGDALVRPFAVARCDLDSAFINSNLSTAFRAAVFAHIADPRLLEDFGPHPFKGPFAYGHECVAEVVELGSAVTQLAVGDIVVVPFQISCGTCSNCKAKLTSHCTTDRPGTFSAYGFGDAGGAWGGAMSDLVRVPFADHMLHPVPDRVDPISLASAGDNISDGWRRVAPHLAAAPGGRVLILGGQAKSVGLYAAGIAVALGASTVDYVDTNKQRLEIAEQLGARPIRRQRKDKKFQNLGGVTPSEYEISVDANGHAAALDYAIRSLRPGGVCSVPAFHFRKTTPVPVWEMYAKSLRLDTGLARPGTDLPEVLELVASGRFKPGLVTTLVADWDDAPTALLDRSPKVVITRPKLN